MTGEDRTGYWIPQRNKALLRLSFVLVFILGPLEVTFPPCPDLYCTLVRQALLLALLEIWQ